MRISSDGLLYCFQTADMEYIISIQAEDRATANISTELKISSKKVLTDVFFFQFSKGTFNKIVLLKVIKYTSVHFTLHS